MTVLTVVESREAHLDPTDSFNDLMRKTTAHMSVIEAVRLLNPAFVAKVEAALTGATRSRNEANAQHAAIRDALTDTFPHDDERYAITNWFVYAAMAFGYGQAHRMLAKFVHSAGDPLSVPLMAPPAPQLNAAHIPGFRIGPLKSPARARAVKAVASLGNPYGAGRIFKAALETYAETSALLSPLGGLDPQGTGLIRSALDTDAIDIAIEGGSDDLLRTPVEPYTGDPLGCSVAVDLAPHWRETIKNWLTQKCAQPGSVQYWATTLEKLGLDPSNYQD